MRKQTMAFLFWVVAMLPMGAVADSFTDKLLAPVVIEDITGISNQVANVKTCYAYTTCPGGYTVSCTAYGQGCRYRTHYGVGVKCTGYNAAGMWSSWWARC